MLKQMQFSVVLAIAMAAMLAFRPDSVGPCVGIIIAVLLIGYERFLERHRADQIKGLESQIKEIKNRVEAIQLSRGLGR